jgi:hypothetical protein
VASSRVAPAQKRGTMPRGRVGPPLLAGAQPVLDVTPVVRRGVGRIDADRLDLIDCAQNATDVRPARDAEKDSPPDGQRQGGKGLAGATARRTSMREMIVPKSFDGQRTKAKTLSGAKLTMRTRRLRTVSSAIRPKRTQCSIRFSSQSARRMLAHPSAGAWKVRWPKRWRTMCAGGFRHGRDKLKVCGGRRIQ